MKIKTTLLTTIAIFAATLLLSQNVYAAVSITSVSWNEATVEPFEQVVPSQDRPLEFNFVSRDDQDNDLTADFRCELLRIDIDADVDNDNIPNGIDLDGNGIGDIAQSDLDQVASDNCGDNTSTGTISYTNIGEGSYVFIVTADPLASGEPITSDTFPFFVPPFQANEPGSGATTDGVLDDVSAFWKNCPNEKAGTSGGQFYLQDIDYIIKGKANLDKLHITNQKIKLKIITYETPNSIDGRLASGSSDTEFVFNYVDTKCNYKGAGTAGGPETSAPKVPRVDETFNSWNPPILDCSTTNPDLFKRELNYPFKITSGLNDLKKTNSNHLLIKINVDRVDKDSVAVDGEIFLGKDKKDKDIKILVEPERPPEVECSGRGLIT